MGEGIKISGYLFVAVVSGGVAWLTAHFTGPQDRSPSVATESTYARAMRTGEIRCAYAVYEPPLIRDPNTGQLSGIFYDVMEEVGHRLNLKINWVAEVGYGTIAEGFNADKYDAFCNTVWPTPERSQVADFTIPLYYSPVDVFVRADDRRFDGALDRLDNPSMTFAVKDGDVSASFAAQLFPHARTVSIPDMADTSQLLEDVAHHKADAAINSPELLDNFLEKNPGSLRDITPDHPVNAAPNTIMIKRGEYEFKRMLDLTLEGLVNSGFIDSELKKYASFHPAILRLAAPYNAVVRP